MTAHVGTASLSIVLDRTSPIPLYHQLKEQFIAAIQQGILKPGDTLEREDLLAERLDIARPTLRRALGDLSDRGLLTRSRGQGTVVNEPQTVAPPPATSRLQPTDGRGRIATRVLRLDPEHVDPVVAKELGLDELSRLVYLEQLLVFDGCAVGLRRSWLPAIFVNPVLQDLTVVPFGWILSETGHAITSERRTFGRLPADEAERAALGIEASGHVFTICGVSFDRKGAPVKRTTMSCRHELDHYDALLSAG